MDNGPEFTSALSTSGRNERGVELIFIRPASPLKTPTRKLQRSHAAKSASTNTGSTASITRRTLRCVARRLQLDPTTRRWRSVAQRVLLQCTGGHARPCTASPLNDRGPSTNNGNCPYPLQPAKCEVTRSTAIGARSVQVINLRLAARAITRSSSAVPSSPGQRAVDVQPQTLAGRSCRSRSAAQRATVAQAVVDEVHRPALRGALRSRWRRAPCAACLRRRLVRTSSPISGTGNGRSCG